MTHLMDGGRSCGCCRGNLGSLDLHLEQLATTRDESVPDFANTLNAVVERVIGAICRIGDCLSATA